MITLIRLILSPVVFYFLIHAEWMTAMILFIIAGSTDLLDGYVARTYNQQSRLGEILDPIADKCLLLAAMLAMALAFTDHILTYGLGFLFVKECILLGVGGLLFYWYDFFIKPTKLSRLAGILEFLLIALLIVVYAFKMSVPTNVIELLIILVCLPSALLLVRYGLYLKRFFKK